MSDILPYSTEKAVLAISDEVPAHEMVCFACMSRAIVGKIVEIPFRSMLHTTIALASDAATKIISFLANMFSWLCRLTSSRGAILVE